MAVAAALVTATACGEQDGPGRAAPATVEVAGEAVAVGPLADAHDALCRASVEAGPDPAGARATFFDGAHDAVHTVARGVGAASRADAAALLEAKAAVEAALEDRAPSLAADLAGLAAAYRSALGRLAITVGPCVE